MKDIVGIWLMKWRIHVVLPHVRGRLIDIGCGTNQLVKSYGGEGVGVDVYQWGDVDLVVQDSSKLPFQDKEFDTIAIIASLNHIPNRKSVLREAFRLLHDDGIMIITMIPPGVSKIWHRLREHWDVDQSERGMKEGETFGFSDSELDHLIKEAGFQIRLKIRFMLSINRLIIAQKGQKGNY